MEAPKILLSGTKNLHIYADAVEKAGGIPDARYCPVYSDEYDGLILCGGADVEPGRYGQPMNGSVDPDPIRDEAEWKLVDAFLQAGKPIFGICRGSQLLNVYFGGTLRQDIPERPRHRLDPSLPYLIHRAAAQDPLLEEMYGKEFAVNSCHHQGIEHLAPRMEPMAVAPDGLIEAAFVPGQRFACAVQWHPEFFPVDDPVSGMIFRAFVEACR